MNRNAPHPANALMAVTVAAAHYERGDVALALLFYGGIAGGVLLAVAGSVTLVVPQDVSGWAWYVVVAAVLGAALRALLELGAKDAEAVGAEAGRLTARYLLANRIPRAAQASMSMLSSPTPRRPTQVRRPAAASRSPRVALKQIGRAHV